MIKVAIVGAGKGGSALLDVFHTNGEVRVVGITDKDKNAGGLSLAKGWGIFVASDIKDLYGQNPDIVINATGETGVSELIKDSSPYLVEIIEGTSARFLWELVKRQQEAKDDMAVLYKNGILLTKATSLKEVLNEVLRSAMELTETPAGSIALIEADEMVMAAQRGLSPDFFKESRWRPRKDGLTSYILSHREAVEFQDTQKEPIFKGTMILSEGIRSILASPLFLDSGVVGILYLDDFRPRKFTDRHKELIKLFSAFAAQAIEKFKLLHDLEESNSYFQCVLDDSADMIVTTDMEGRIVKFSKGGERILGYSKEEVIGRRAADFYIDKEERAEILEVLRDKGAIYNYETRLLRKDNTPVDISLTISQLRDNSGKVIGTVGVSKDITDDKRLRIELEEKNRELRELTERLEEKVIERTKKLKEINRELERSNQIKSRFIANMSHELRTPLNSIIGFSEILLEKTFGPLTEKQERYTDNIFSSGKHLLQLVNNILDLAKIEAGKIDLNYETFQVEDAVKEVIMVIHSLTDRKMIELVTDIDTKLSFITADKVKFKQILYNLFSNAVKFTPEGGRIGIRTEKVVNRSQGLPWAVEGQEFLRTSVWDTGIGIKPEDMDKIFDEFEQVDSSMSRRYEGTGLGLSLTKKLVELHGGQIDVTSTIGKGSTFSFYIPIIARDAVVEKEGLKAVSMDYPWMREDAPLVLVVEDDPSTSEILTIHLTQAGYKVAHAYDGEDAISKAMELKPFIITLDIMLPKKDGWEVMQSLKAEEETRNIPILIHSIVDNRELAFALGAADYLIKPIDKKVLLDKLEELSLMSKRHRYPVNVLLIDNDAETQSYLYPVLESEGFLMHSAQGVQEGIELAVATRPNAIIIDVNISDKGFGVVGELKANPATRTIPIFILTSKELTVEDRVSMAGQIERIIKKGSFKAEDMIRHLKELELFYPRRAGLIDELTGLFNHRYFQIRLAQEVNRATRYKSPLTLILLDIDNFGHYVDTKGDYYGNLVLKKIAEILRKHIRGSDVVVRYGGDAFSVILPNTLLSSGLSLSKRFNSLIYDYPFLHEEIQPKGRITASFGVAAFSGQSPEELILFAEKALSMAIQKGGNRVEVYSEGLE